MHAKPKTTQQMYVKTLQEIVFMKKPGESIADVISRIVKTYKSRTEDTECFSLWQQERSKVELLDEENMKKENRIVSLEEENRKLKEAVNHYMSSQIIKNPPPNPEQSSL